MVQGCDRACFLLEPPQALRIAIELGVGESSKVTTLWLRFPELSLQPLAQEYTRLAENRYQYHSFPHDFTAELTVDEAGLVVDYGDLFTRVATGT